LNVPIVSGRNSWGARPFAVDNGQRGTRREIALDAFVVMPDHVHGILMIMDGDMGSVGALRLPPRSKAVPVFWNRLECVVGGAVPLRASNNSADPYRDPFQPSFAHANPPSPPASTASATTPSDGKGIVDYASAPYPA
jgi:hypothetical protein